MHGILTAQIPGAATQPNISKTDISFASILINKFVSSFQDLYGEINMTYHLHCHLHLPLQVLLYGQFIGNYKFFNNFQIKENHEFRKIYNKLQLTTNNLHTNKYGLVNFTSKPIQNLTANEQTLLINLKKGLIASNLVKHSYRFVKDSTEFASYITHKQNIMTQNY